MEINKCQFCEKYFPGSDGIMKCNAASYELKYDNICKDAIDRMMNVLTVERVKKSTDYDGPWRSDVPYVQTVMPGYARR